MSEYTDPLAFFGLAPDATRAQLKRAYAQRLRATRPGDDPEGFQRLHGTYQRALAEIDEPPLMLNAEDLDDDDFDPDALLRPGVAASIAPDADIVPDFDALLAAVLLHGGRDDAAALTQWLTAHESLWPITQKRLAAHALAHDLHETRPPIGPGAFAALAAFFDEWRVDRGVDPFGMQTLGPALMCAWWLQPAGLQDCAQRLVVRRFTRHPRSALAYLRQLVRPFRFMQALTLSLIPLVPTRMARLLVLLAPLPASVDPRQAAWWRASGDRTRWSWPRTSVGIARAIVWPIVFGTPLLLLEGERGTSLAWNVGSAVWVSLLVWLGTVLGTLQRKEGTGSGGALIVFGLVFASLFGAAMLRSCVAG